MFKQMPPSIISAINNPPSLTINQISSFKKKYTAIKQFMENQSLNIGFFIGPSGSGKLYLILSFLNSINMSYQLINYAEITKGTNKTKDLCTSIFKFNPQDVIICREFLEPSLNAYYQFYEYMKNFRGKVIFILNIGQYSIKNLKKFIQVRARGRTFELHNASLNQFREYSKTQMITILNTFNSKIKNQSIKYTKQILGQLTDLYQGDARKIMNQLYFRNKTNTVKMDDFGSKVSIFHFLGKLLYNKRLVLPNMQIKDSKKCDLGFYRQMSSEQILKYDPPFYFDPIQLMRQSYLPFQIMLGFIMENFPKFYNSIEDSRNLNKLLAQLFISKKLLYKQSWRAQQQMDSLQLLLLSNGVMIYNIHGYDKAKKFMSISAPNLWQSKKQAEIKLQLLSKNFPQISIPAIWELYGLRRYLPENSFPLLKFISKILNTGGTSYFNKEVNRIDCVQNNNNDTLLNRNYRIRDKIMEEQFQEYEEISSDQN